MLRSSERDHRSPSMNPPATPGLRRRRTPNEVLDAVISSGSTADTVDISTRVAIVGLDPGPLRGRSLIAKGEAGLEARVRKTLGDTDSTPQRGS
jgi:hypothetical protein